MVVWIITRVWSCRGIGANVIMSRQVFKYPPGETPEPGKVVTSPDFEGSWMVTDKKALTNITISNYTVHDSCEALTTSTGGTVDTPTYTTVDYCSDGIDVTLDRMYINPNSTIKPGDKVFFNGRGFIKTGNKGTATHVLSAMPTVVEYDTVCTPVRTWKDDRIWDDDQTWPE